MGEPGRRAGGVAFVVTVPGGPAWWALGCPRLPFSGPTPLLGSPSVWDFLRIGSLSSEPGPGRGPSLLLAESPLDLAALCGAREGCAVASGAVGSQMRAQNVPLGRLRSHLSPSVSEWWARH